jgi:glycosyltransferase involved in cell wall biosynthesis
VFVEMKVVIVNTSEKRGGAAVAANRIMFALQKAGVEARMLVRDKMTDNQDVISINTSFLKRTINFLRFVWERLIIFLNNGLNREKLFKVSIANTGSDISKHPLIQGADIIHLHWVNQGFLSLKSIRQLIGMGKPVVWTLHDMWPCTGICHHAYTCVGYLKSCGSCPFLNSERKKDLSFRTLKKKLFFSKRSFQVVTVSTWLKKEVTRSTLMKSLKTAVIPNVIDLNIYKFQDKKHSRAYFSLAEDKKIVLMGAARLDDEIKGGKYLQEALTLLTDPENIMLILFGNIKGGASFLDKMTIPFIHLGPLYDSYLVARLYSASDVTVVPSLYETFGQTIIESMACGCPVVSFNNSGQTDIIDHLENGYLAEYLNVNDFAKGIEWALNKADDPMVKESCKEKVKMNYSEEIIAQKYLSLYKNML